MTQKWLAKTRPSTADHHMVWETLTHAEQGSRGMPSSIAPAKSGKSTGALKVIPLDNGSIDRNGIGKWRISWQRRPCPPPCPW